MAVPASSQLRPTLAGMSCVDTSGNERIPVLMQLVGALSRARTPQDVQREFALGLQELQGPQGYVSLSTRGLAPGQYRITRMVTADDTADLNADPWSSRDSLEVHEGGFFSEIIRQAYPEIIQNFYLQDDPIVGDRLANYGSILAVPLFDDGEPLNWAIMLRQEPAGFTIQDLEDAILRANLIGTTVKNVLAAQELGAAHKVIRREMEQIADIQRALLPRRIPEIPGLVGAASYETYDAAGGDYYDFFPFRDEQTGRTCWGVLIADAAGHGPAAAVLMAMLHAILHAYPHMPEGPARILAHANHHLCAKGIESSFVTAFFALFDPETRTLSFSNAGHPPPLLKNPGHGGAVRRLCGAASLPLGVIREAEYEEATIVLEPGQTVVLYTDGISEAMGPDRGMFGTEGIEAALHACSGMPGCVIDSVTAALLAHEAGVRPSDDQTLVTLRVED